MKGDVDMTKPIRGAWLLTSVGALLLSGILAPTTATASPGSLDPHIPLACNPTWRTVASPNVGSEDNSLASVDAVSATDVWAVGNTASGDTRSTLIEHWDGTQWTDVPTPHPSRYSRLRSVDASASNDVWAVGEITRDFKQRTLTQHFDGTSWVTVPSPNQGISVDYMSSVSVAAPNDVW